jgi:hypothetical protein
MLSSGLFLDGNMYAKRGLAPLLEETTFIKGGLLFVINNEFINKAPARALAQPHSSVLLFERG